MTEKIVDLVWNFLSQGNGDKKDYFLNSQNERKDMSNSVRNLRWEIIISKSALVFPFSLKGCFEDSYLPRSFITEAVVRPYSWEQAKLKRLLKPFASLPLSLPEPRTFPILSMSSSTLASVFLMEKESSISSCNSNATPRAENTSEKSTFFLSEVLKLRPSTANNERTASSVPFASADLVTTVKSTIRRHRYVQQTAANMIYGGSSSQKSVRRGDSSEQHCGHFETPRISSNWVEDTHDCFSSVIRVNRKLPISGFHVVCSSDKIRQSLSKKMLSQWGYLINPLESNLFRSPNSGVYAWISKIIYRSWLFPQLDDESRRKKNSVIQSIQVNLLEYPFPLEFIKSDVQKDSSSVVWRVSFTPGYRSSVQKGRQWHKGVPRYLGRRSQFREQPWGLQPSG